MNVKRIYNHSERIIKDVTVTFQDNYALYCRAGDYVILTVLVADEDKPPNKEEG